MRQQAQRSTAHPCPLLSCSPSWKHPYYSQARLMRSWCWGCRWCWGWTQQMLGRYLMAAPSHPPVPWAGTSVCRWHCPPPTARRAPHPPLSSRTHPRRKSAARRGADTPKVLAWRLRHNCTQWHGEGECCCLSVFRWLCMSRSHHASRVDRWISEGTAGVRRVRVLRHSSRDAICWLNCFFFSLLKRTQLRNAFFRPR